MLAWSQFVTQLGANVLGASTSNKANRPKKCSNAFVLNSGWRLVKSSEREKKKNEFGEQ